MPNMTPSITPIPKGSTDWDMPLNANMQMLAEGIGRSAPANHASPDGAYGIATDELLGHVKFLSGNALEAKAFPVYYHNEQVELFDPNQLLTEGRHYFINVAAAAANVTNMPTGTWYGANSPFSIDVFKFPYHANQYTGYRQEVRRLLSTYTYERYMYYNPGTGAWSVYAWYQNFNEQNKPTASDVSSNYYSLTASRALLLTDATSSRFVFSNSTSAITITIPTATDVEFPTNTSIKVCRYSTGACTIAAATGVTIVSALPLAIPTRYEVYTLHKFATNSWLVYKG